MPYRAVTRQGLAALSRQCVGTPFPSGLGDRPTAAEQTVLLKAVQHRVDRAFWKFESTGAAPEKTSAAAQAAQKVADLLIFTLG
jgi:hypothetical protein